MVSYLSRILSRILRKKDSSRYPRYLKVRVIDEEEAVKKLMGYNVIMIPPSREFMEKLEVYHPKLAKAIMGQIEKENK
jgi:hypothetical protein